jgi:hypothetical protein
MCGIEALRTFEQVLHFGHVTITVVSCIRMVRQVTAWLHAIGDLPAQLPEDLAYTRLTNFGLQETQRD